MQRLKNNSNDGFTLVEIMIVVMIIALLAAIALPSFVKARNTARVNATCNDLRVFYAAFQQYAMERGNYPTNAYVAGVLPAPMVPYLNSNKWSRGAETGGQFYFKSSYYSALSNRPAIGIVGTIGNPPDATSMLSIDQTIDNGDLASGQFIRLSLNAYYYYVDQ